jgi:hypothetical protein
LFGSLETLTELSVGRHVGLLSKSCALEPN